MNNEALDSLRSQVNTTYCTVTRTYDAAGNITGESRAEHPEPTIRLTHDQGVELLALINELESEQQVTHESAIDFLRNEGWLQKHDKTLTEGKEPVMPRSEYQLPAQLVFEYECECAAPLLKGQPFCMKCGRSVKWE